MGREPLGEGSAESTTAATSSKARTGLPGTGNASAAAGLMKLFWGTNKSFGDASLRFVLDFGAGSLCDLRVGIVGRARGSVTDVILVESDDGQRWGSGGGGLAHARVVNTAASDALLFDNWYRHVQSRKNASLAGVLTITIVARGVQPVRELLLDNQSVAVDLECQAPFRVLAAQWGSEAMVGTLVDFQGGAGVSAYPAGWGGIQRFERAFGGPEACIRFGVLGNHAGAVNLSSPSSSKQFLAPLPSQARMCEGPGRYAFDAAQVGFEFSSFWVATYQFTEHVDLVPGQKAAPTKHW